MVENEIEQFASAQKGGGEKAEEKELEMSAGQEENKVAQPQPYHVFGSDMTVTKAEFITYYKYRMKMMIMKYKLVGRVGDDGQYRIADEIRRDLVKMEKEIEDQNEFYYKAIALYMKKHFYYSIRIQLLDDGTAKASLYLSEFVDNFLGHEYIVTHVADFVDIYDDEYRVKLRKAFHLVDVETKVDDMAVPELAVVMQDAFDFELIAGDLYDMASQVYLMSMLKELEASGPIGAEVLARYRQLLAEGNIEVDEKFRYTSYKALLDRVMDEFGGLEGIGLDPVKVSKIVSDMNKMLQQVDKASVRGPLEMQTIHPDAKDGMKKAAGAKKAAQKKPPEKKPEQKKDAKKDDKKKAEEEAKKSSYYTPSAVKPVDVSDIDLGLLKMGAVVISEVASKVVENVVKAIEDDFMRGGDIQKEQPAPPKEPEQPGKEDVFAAMDDIDIAFEDQASSSEQQVSVEDEKNAVGSAENLELHVDDNIEMGT